MKNTLIHNKIYDEIKRAENVLLVTHERPDADAVSSVCAMIELLEGMGKEYFAYCFNEAPGQLRFLPHAEKISSDRRLLDFEERDLVLVFDCGDLKRTKLADEIKNKANGQRVMNIDHHPKIDNFADFEIKMPEAASTTEIIYDFFKANDLTINKNIAMCILTGLTEDTGNFLYPSTSEKTVRISSEMIASGARLPQIMENTIRNKSLATLKIWGMAMSRLAVNEKYEIAYTVLTQDDVKNSNVSDEDLEGVANFLGNMKDVKAVMFLRELADGMIKGSIRSSHPDIDASLLARKFSGGGHAKAAGFALTGRLVRKNDEWRVE